jgi:hypothetical protein
VKVTLAAPPSIRLLMRELKKKFWTSMATRPPPGPRTKPSALSSPSTASRTTAAMSLAGRKRAELMSDLMPMPSCGCARRSVTETERFTWFAPGKGVSVTGGAETS